MPAFDAISVGDSAEVKHIVTEADLQKFVDLTGDDNRLHVDKEYAGRTAFKSRVVHGMLGASFISTVIGTKLPGDGALWFSQSLEFLAPLRVGDEITVVATVTQKIDRDRVVVLSTDVFNQDKQKVTTGVAKVKVVEPAVEQAPATAASPATRVALVIGATGGVGKAVARVFAARGNDLILVYRSNPAAAEVLRDELAATGVRVMLARGDASDEAFVTDLERNCRRFAAGLDYVVNTATAPIASVALDKLDWNDFEKHLFANVKSSFLLARTLSPLMEGRRSPTFVFLSSQAADAPVQGWLPYVTAKAALDGLARSLALELAAQGVRANVVSPGMIDTDLVAAVPQKARLMIAARTPRRRLATVGDVAAAVAYLCSDDADYLTGETLRINGGQLMR